MEPAYRYNAVVRRWVDGDTVDLRVDVGFHIAYEDRFRLLWVNTPERSRPGYLDAISRVNELAPIGSTTVIECVKVAPFLIDQDKYGRYLALVHPAKQINGVEQTGYDRSINEILVAEGLGLEYMKNIFRTYPSGDMQKLAEAWRKRALVLPG